MVEWFGRIRQVFRRLARHPSFSLIAVLTLALGIGANSAIFTVVNSVLLRPLPFPGQERIYAIGHSAPGMGTEEVPNSEATYLIYRDENRVFQAFGVYRDGAENITGDQEPERASSLILTHDVFHVFGAVPALGRLTDEADDLPGSPRVTVLSHGLWQRRFGGDPAVVGRGLVINGEAHEIVGVLPPTFSVPQEEPDLYLPARIDRSEPDEGSFNYTGVARIRPGVGEEAVESDMARMIQLIPERFTGMITQTMLDQIGFAPRIAPLKEEVVGDISQALWILLASVGLVLLIACANVANLFLVRAEGRRKEVAVRTAMGASKGDMSRHFLGESVVLALLAGVAGLLLAWGASRALVTFGPRELPRLGEIALDVRVLVFTLAISLLAGVVFGLFPVLKFRRLDLATGLKEGGRGDTEGRERHRARNLLVVSQMALALVLLAGSGLMLRSFHELRNVDPGFDPQGVLSFRITLPEAAYSEGRARLEFHRLLHERLAGIPGVGSVGATTQLPLSGSLSRTGTWFEGFPLRPGQVPDVVETSRVSAGFFETMGIRLLDGRFLSPFDARDRTGAAVISRSLARTYWPDEIPLGRRLTQSVDFGADEGGFDPPWQTIVGVVEDVRTRGMDVEAQPLLFLPLRQAVPDSLTYVPGSLFYVVRTSGQATAITDAIRDAVWSLDPNLPVADLRTMASLVQRSMARTSFTMALLALAALVALVLGTVGIYGVISYVVAQRTREIGVRMALGARKEEVSGMVLRQGAILVVAGVGIGLLAAFGLTRLMESLLYGVSAADPLTYGAMALLLAGVALLATWLPARRASRTDPVEALRHE